MTAEHKFGGAWTEQKLSAVQYYAEFYTGALRGRRDAPYQFDLWYIDAFAGSGERTETVLTGGLFEGTPTSWETVQLDGSAKRAMAVSPPFKHLIFMEPDPKRFAALKALEAVDARVSCVQGDANIALPELFSRPIWRTSGAGKGLQRGLVFLDPYGMQVPYTTLELLASTKRVDVFYLFPLEAVIRQLAHDYAAVDQWKQDALDAVLGGPDWRDQFYEDRLQQTVFGDLETIRNRTVTRRDVESWFQNRLSKTFAFVSPPLPLGDGNLQKFSLFLAVANDSAKAVQLAKSGVRDMLKRQEYAASRQMSGL
ncbi:three-Cys-motif partner protein TcmP [Brevundimonas sp. NPDC092305]|uniref:three-Cys-motif partner protein TcmP n=1 Tax=Brevundimonas sp. NPDC092305 TaxID=3363957 RepID=UPI00380EB3E9